MVYKISSALVCF